MARNPTNWSNNDVKPPASWSGVAKGVANWANNITKVPAVFTQRTKSVDAWGVNYQRAQTYYYNDSNMIYNDPNVQYNYLLNSNQSNQKLITRWGQVV
jgi:hypothetical protein